MADEKERDLARTPDQRMQYGEIRRREKEGAGRGGPSPYDEAPEDAPDDRVITKGEREKPGPTETSSSTGDRGSERDRSGPHVSGTDADRGSQRAQYPPDQALSDRGVVRDEAESLSPAGPVIGDSAYNDELLHTSQVDRGNKPAPQRGMGRMSGSLEEEEALEANEDSGTLGGEALHKRLNHEAVLEDMPGDEESA